MSEDTSAVSSVKIKKTRWEYLSEWFRSPAFKSIVMWIITFLVILLLFFVVCIPQKYDLSVGRISRETINATKDVVDEVSTQEKREAAAAQITPSYQFQAGVKEEVMNALNESFNELRTIQQYGMTLRSDESTQRKSFTEDEIAYAIGLQNFFSLKRNQIVTILRVDNDQFEQMVRLVTTAVENKMNSRVHEGQVEQEIQNILQIVGYQVDISLVQNILPTVLRLCIKPNMIIDQEALEDARTAAMNAVEPVTYLQGQNIVREGDRVTNSQIEMLRSLGLLNEENLEALEKGLPNLLQHVSNVRNEYGLPCVVAINAFPSDTKAELDMVEEKCHELGVNVALSEVWAKGGEGGVALAEEVVKLCEEPNDFSFSYCHVVADLPFKGFPYFIQICHICILDDTSYGENAPVCKSACLLNDFLLEQHLIIFSDQNYIGMIVHYPDA